MGVFEYIVVLISVIMGLGITHLATGATKLIQNRDKVRFYLPHAIWTVNVLIYILMIWWSMFWWSGHEDWYAYEYLFITLYSIVLFFLAAMLYPWDMDKDIDVRAYFFRNRTWFFGGMAVAWLIDIPETLVKSKVDLRAVPEEYYVFVGLELAIAVTGLVSQHRIVHTLLPFAWMLLTIYYSFASIIGQISA
jgi:hypothetical protein